MDETFDEGLDPDWDEPRGPHLPDAITSVPRLVWPFVGLAVAIVWQWWNTFGSSWSQSAGDLVLAAVATSPRVVAALIGGAVFLRHPDAWWTQRFIAAGATLLAVYEALVLADPLIRPVIESLSPGPVDTPFLAPPVVAYDVLHALLQVGGILCLARGLSLARRWREVGSGRGVIATALIAALGGLVIDVLVLGPTAIESFDSILLAAVWLGLIAIGALAWAYLAATATLGYRAAEEPRLAWFLAAVAGWGQLALAFAGSLANVLVVVIGQAEDSPFTFLFFRVTGVANAVISLSLLAAFMLGLPADKEVDPPQGPGGAEDEVSPST